jgi:NhaA family Na+:H+ antiporter
MPGGASWRHLYGAALLCGIGFTMSLFIGALAFPGDASKVDGARIGTLAGSLLAALAGWAVLRFAPRLPGEQATTPMTSVSCSPPTSVRIAEAAAMPLPNWLA